MPHELISSDSSTDPDARQLALTVTAFDVGKDGGCTLSANWSISERGGDRSRHFVRDSFAIQAPKRGMSATDAEVVACMTAAVSALADRISVSASLVGAKSPTP
jgi:uncharacterized lipoprotein YmbA